jgi:hypothetical protein
LRREGRRVIVCAQQREAVDMLEVFICCCGIPVGSTWILRDQK